jgi:hypothetical protein
MFERAFWAWPTMAFGRNGSVADRDTPRNGGTPDCVQDMSDLAPGGLGLAAQVSQA